jgi:hypothetical protein
LVVVPIIIMSCFKDKKDRYLLPMIGPIAVLAAMGLEDWQRKARASAKTPCAILAGYFLVLAAIPIAFAIFASVGYPHALRGIDAKPWLSWSIAGPAIVVCGIALGVALWLRGRHVPLFTLIFMAIFMHLLTVGYYLHSTAGQSKMLVLANRIWAECPSAKLYTTLPFGARASEDLSIYANRTTGWITLDQMRQTIPGRDPVVVITRQEKAAPMPALPDPWRLFMSVPKEASESWQVYLLPAQENPETTQESATHVR